PFRARAAPPARGAQGCFAGQLRNGTARESRHREAWRPTSSATMLRSGACAPARRLGSLRPPFLSLVVLLLLLPLPLVSLASCSAGNPSAAAEVQAKHGLDQLQCRDQAVREGKQWQLALALRRNCGWATISRTAGSSPWEKGGKQWQPTLALREKCGWATISNNAGSSPCEQEGRQWQQALALCPGEGRARCRQLHPTRRWKPAVRREAVQGRARCHQPQRWDQGKVKTCKEGEQCTSNVISYQAGISSGAKASSGSRSWQCEKGMQWQQDLALRENVKCRSGHLQLQRWDQLVCGRAGSQWKHLARSGGRSWSPILSGTLWQTSCEKRGAKLEPTSVESSGPTSCEKWGAKLEPSIGGSSVRSLLREAGGEAGAKFSRELWASFVREVGGAAGAQYLSYNAGINSCEKGKTGSGSKDCQACQPRSRPSFSGGQCKWTVL
ncbi:unnamed protein product, partial [Prorocentrum cordatum]